MSTHANARLSAENITADETTSHEVLKDHSFPVNSIGPADGDAPWKCNQNNDYYETLEDKEGKPYVSLLGDVVLWQDIVLHPQVNPSPEEGARPQYRIGFQYYAGMFEDCWFFIVDADDIDHEIYRFKLPAEGDALWDNVTWHYFDVRKIPIPEAIERIRVMFTTPDVARKNLYLREVVTELLLPAFDDVALQRGN